jgi:predicted pyridoxine 5'-phosphate oxidase superfamily flavin-nucleotide-binding protein
MSVWGQAFTYPEGDFNMAAIPDRVLDILAEPRSVKMVGTVDNSGVPNVVIISTLSVLNPETIAFADICLGKTRRNLQQNGKITVAVIGSEKEAYQIECRFVHFEDSTSLYDLWRNAVWNRMKMELKGVAVAGVVSVRRAEL